MSARPAGPMELEPEPLRVVLAVFAALYPEHGAAAADEIRRMADKHPGTDADQLLDLACALADQDDERAEQLASAFARPLHRNSVSGAPDLPIGIRVTQILNDSVRAILEYNVDRF